MDFFLESRERGYEDGEFWIRLSELACWKAGEMVCPSSYIYDGDGANARDQARDL
jgi:hypothetical protein